MGPIAGCRLQDIQASETVFHAVGYDAVCSWYNQFVHETVGRYDRDQQHYSKVMNIRMAHLDVKVNYKQHCINSQSI